MDNILLICLITCFFPICSFAQTKDSSAINRNSIYIEGYLIRHDFSDGFVSINYDRNIGKKRRTNLRIGIYPDLESTMSFPITISRITNTHSNHHFEYGLGAVFRIEHFVDPLGINTREWFYDMPAIMIPLMYRYQKNSGWFFRGGINVFVSWPTLASPSLSAGYKF